MGNKAKQRFVELDVNEVSLVDNGANEQEFVVIKNLTTEEVGEMADDNVKKNQGEEDTQSGTSPERVPVEVEKGNNEAVEAAMAQVTEMIGNISKAVEAASSTGEKSVEKSDGGESEEKPTEKSESEEKSADGEAEAEVQKDDNAEAGAGVDEEADVEKMLGVLAVAVEKAKRFTPKREKAFKAALEALTTLAKELGMTEIPTGASPPVSTPKGAMYGASSVPIAKALEDLASKIETAISGVQETTKSLGERVEQIEKARMPSQSVEDEGGTDTQETKKSFWSGVL